MDLWGTENNSPVVQFLISIVLLAAVEMRFSKNIGTETNFQKSQKVVQKMALRQ